MFRNGFTMIPKRQQPHTLPNWLRFDKQMNARNKEMNSLSSGDRNNRSNRGRGQNNKQNSAISRRW